MPYAFVAQTSANDSSTSATVAITGVTLGAGESVIGWAKWPSATGTLSSVSDGTNGYTVISGSLGHNTDNGHSTELFYAHAVTAGTYTITATLSASYAGGKAIGILRCTGLKNQAPLASKGNFQITPVAAGTDVVTSGSMGPVTFSAAAIIFGFTISDIAASPVSAGTSMTDRGAISAYNSLGGDTSDVADRRVTTSGSSYAATFTSGGTSDEWLTAAAIFEEQPSGPTITAQPSNTQSYIGGTATFSVTATGTPTLTYQWYKNGTSIPGATSSSYTTPTLVSGDNGNTYRCDVTDGASVTTQSNTVTLTLPPPTFTAQPTQQSAASGATATFSGTATSVDPGGVTYQWQSAPITSLFTNVPGTWANVGGATSSSYTTGTLSSADNGSWFRLAATDSNGTTYSFPARVFLLGLGATGMGAAVSSELENLGGWLFQHNLDRSYRNALFRARLWPFDDDKAEASIWRDWMGLSSGGGTTYTLTVSASVGSTAAKAVAAQAIRSAATSSAAALARAAAAIRSATEGSSAVVVRAPRAIRSASTSSSATLAAIKTKLLTLTAAVASSAVVAKLISAQRSASTSAAALIVKLAGAIRSATSAESAAVSKSRVVTLSAAVGSSAVVQRAASAVRAASTACGTAVTRAASATRSAGTAAAAVVVKGARAARSAAQASTATLGTLKAKLLTLTASVGSSAAVVRSVRAVRLATTTATASMARAVSITRAVVQTSAAAVTNLKVKFLTLTASVGSAVSMRKAVNATRSAATVMAALAGKVISKQLQAVSALIGSVTLNASTTLVFAISNLRVWFARRLRIAGRQRVRAAAAPGRQRFWSAGMDNELEKSTRETATFTLDCTDLLGTDEVITGNIAFLASEPNGLTFTGGVVNTVPVSYPFGRSSAVGKALQFKCAGGAMQADGRAQRYTGRALFDTSVAGNRIEATFTVVVDDRPKR